MIFLFIEKEKQTHTILLIQNYKYNRDCREEMDVDKQTLSPPLLREVYIYTMDENIKLRQYRMNRPLCNETHRASTCANNLHCIT